MTIKSGIFNSVNGDRRYKAQDFASYFAMFIANGVFPNPSNGFQVMANNIMTVSLKAGKAWINGYFTTNDSDYNLSIDVADGVLNRIDRIVLQLNYFNREIIPVVKKGTFASTPVAPTLKRDADAYEIALADIYVGKGITSITQSNIADLRLNTSLCGIVHGTVQQVDTTTLFNQYQSWFGEFTTAKQADFVAWLATLQDILSGDVAANLASRIQSLEQTINSHLEHFTQLKEQVENMELTAENVTTTAGSNVQTELDNLKSDTDNKINSVRDAIVSKGGVVTGNPPTAAQLVAGVDTLELAYSPKASINVLAFQRVDGRYTSTKNEEFTNFWKATMRMNGSIRVRLFGTRLQNFWYDSTPTQYGIVALYLNGVSVAGPPATGYTAYVDIDLNIKSGDVLEVRGRSIYGTLSYGQARFEQIDIRVEKPVPIFMDGVEPV
ncbi:hypothetical protein F7731_08695 [Cytobacillus depressus]|uniref:Uncharacterized protein n=1 Tax=Cytobacillus depressus TaxID=1602942 RepID=A0A6L3VES5_9BACI|nr:hypothetical protein [Cytobacillus depressus]KAB2337661.1 hypothetical protein F7731_08695 [Cytobacillus depressus]